MKSKELLARFRAARDDFRLAEIDPDDTCGLEKEAAKVRLERATERLGELQVRLHAQDRWAVLLLFQGMDASGKDGTIRSVLAGVDPAGCQASYFKAPSEEELDHDFLWRAARALPERGRIGIFNRSYYEEVVTVRIHRAFLDKQRLPPRCVKKSIWDERLDDVVGFERYLARNGVLIRKFFLHVSRAEQKRRFLARIQEPEKNWKFKESDVAERAHWPEYMRHWSTAIARTSRGHAPWYVVPADRKWFTRLAVAEVVVDALEELALDFPKLTAERKTELARARAALDGTDADSRRAT